MSILLSEDMYFRQQFIRVSHACSFWMAWTSDLPTEALSLIHLMQNRQTRDGALYDLALFVIPLVFLLVVPFVLAYKEPLKEGSVYSGFLPWRFDRERIEAHKAGPALRLFGFKEWISVKQSLLPVRLVLE